MRIECIGPRVHFEQIMHGDAGDDSWNVSGSQRVQTTLADIILNHIYFKVIQSHGDDNHIPVDIHDLYYDESDNATIPEYVRVLFLHHCSKNEMPRLDDIDKIKDEMAEKLQILLFDRIVMERRSYVRDKGTGKKSTSPRVTYHLEISARKLRLLFPTATHYIDDQHEEVDFASALEFDF